MKRFVIFLLLVIALDWAIGRSFAGLYRRTFTGERGGLLNYALTKPADLLILGSSRAQYQVMPAVLSKQLSLTAFNAGLKGHDFLYSVLLYDLWRRRHPAPRVILLQVDIESLLDRPSELEAAQIFAPFLDESPLIREVLYSADPFKPIEYWSRAYRYNGKAFSIARNLFARQDREFDGYMPAGGRLNPETDIMVANALDQDATAIEQAGRPYSERKLHYLHGLAEQAARDQTVLVLFHTPLYNQDRAAHRVWSRRLIDLLAQMPAGVFVDICEATHPDVFANRPDLYRDTNHLNMQGATILSTMLAEQLRRQLSAAAETNVSRSLGTPRHAAN
jgi:hypothetical protein